jgi:hypothetical protein
MPANNKTGDASCQREIERVPVKIPTSLRCGGPAEGQCGAGASSNRFRILR